MALADNFKTYFFAMQSYDIQLSPATLLLIYALLFIKFGEFQNKRVSWQSAWNGNDFQTCKKTKCRYFHFWMKMKLLMITLRMRVFARFAAWNNVQASLLIVPL